MTPQEIINKARRQVHASSVNYTNDDALLDLNHRRQDMIGKIQSEVDEWWYWTWAFANSVIDQNEYNIENVDSTYNINQVDSISVKWKTGWEYEKIPYVHPNSLDNELDSYKTTATPFYFIKDKSIFIYPSPEEAVENGIKLYCIIQPTDLAIADEETRIEPRFQQNIIDWMCADYYYAQGNESKGQFYEAKYEKACKDMVRIIKARNQNPVERIYSLNKYA